MKGRFRDLNKFTEYKDQTKGQILRKSGLHCIKYSLETECHETISYDTYITRTRILRDSLEKKRKS